ncbi:705_t:CDS:1 [Paraglomus occultum]|uniref:705_t:CDS:1 n=1 Tax=Paraglomus occultum TaxID=144539 RepID=A0A9N9A467_9GLOM|nr:705_t:CDS:1 [Paraglomus occultum]
MVSQNDSRSGDTIISKEKSNFIISRSEDVLTSKLDDTRETNTFVPKEQSSANISDAVELLVHRILIYLILLQILASKSLEDEEIDEFLDTKRKVKKLLKKRNSEIKKCLQEDKTLLQKTDFPSITS